MKFGAYNDIRKGVIVWFRTTRSLEAGFYRRNSRRGDPPDVYVAESVPELILKVYPWIRETEAAFQKAVGRLEAETSHDRDSERVSDQMADQLVRRLDPNDDRIWTDDPRWIKHLQPD